jgi:hypothetical protein
VHKNDSRPEELAERTTISAKLFDEARAATSLSYLGRDPTLGGGAVLDVEDSSN